MRSIYDLLPKRLSKTKMEIYYTPKVNRAFHDMFKICKQYRHEFTTPEHFLCALLKQQEFCMALANSGIDQQELSDDLHGYLQQMETVPATDGDDYQSGTSILLRKALTIAAQIVQSSSAAYMYVPHIVRGILQLEECHAAYFLKKQLHDDPTDFLSELVNCYDDDHGKQTSDDDCDFLNDDDDDRDDHSSETITSRQPWRDLVTCLNDTYQQHNPLIGREQELERTIQVLCRKEKNNPLHIGEPGVGKTALVYGLAQRIEEGRVPQRLKFSRIYMLDLGTLLAGTQFRGDFEKRIKMVMDGISKESGHNIVYIDEIHNLVGAGAVGESSMDAGNMLKPYLDAGSLRFIGSTTYEEYNRYFSRSKGLVRRFQQIDISEPSVDETLNILKQLKKEYEKYHGVYYADAALDFAVKASSKYINERFLPDKAIDLIDEAGAYREIHPLRQQKRQTVDKQLVSDLLAKACKVDTLALHEDDSQQLATLQRRILAKIYGQDEAVRQVVEAVQLAKAGLLDDDKPLASLLFVGPTGVGKTEVARVLARELGIELLRFDMSEYTEKHTVAKLIGSPAGYVGYEDGGLLTDAIRKTPNCVLLLDEIEKAHPDIYNILLQVMDYARLTDNKGRKADFRHVILIMTSNAGAQYASQASIGFQGAVSRGEAMLRQVKKTFKPEFINRLSATVVFHDMDRQMATLILRKKLDELQQRLTVRKVQMTLADDAFNTLLREGFTPEYGAREMDRVISARLKPLLMRELLFGRLKKGGCAHVVLRDDALAVDV